MPYLRRHITVQNIRLMYLEREPEGEPDGEAPLFLLHGLLATAETFAGLMENLPAGRRVVALDILSAKPVSAGEELDVHFDALASLIAGFLHAIRLERPVIIGHSHGGALALRIAASERELVQGLVLLCPAHPFSGYRSHVVQFYLKPHGRFLALAIPFAPTWAILRAYQQATGAESRFTRKHLKPYMRILRSRKTLALVLKMLATWENDMANLREALTSSPVTVPTLLMWGDHDYIVPMDTAEALAEHLTASTFVLLPGTGHLIADEAPAACGGYIRDWLGQQFQAQ